MSSILAYTEVLSKVAESLVITEKYSSAEEVFRELAIAAVRRKTAYYQRRLRQFERKYLANFESFTTRLQGKATPAEEDDWLAWRSSRSMLADWQKVHQDLLNESAR